jgi:hypothetical protein
VCWKPCSSCWSFHLLREKFLSAPIHSTPLWFAISVLQHALVIDARYVERIAEGAKLGPEVARWLSPPRLNLGGHGHLMDVGIGGWSRIEGEGLAA